MCDNCVFCFNVGYLPFDTVVSDPNYICLECIWSRHKCGECNQPIIIRRKRPNIYPGCYNCRKLLCSSCTPNNISEGIMCKDCLSEQFSC